MLAMGRALLGGFSTARIWPSRASSAWLAPLSAKTSGSALPVAAPGICLTVRLIAVAKVMSDDASSVPSAR